MSSSSLRDERLFVMRRSVFRCVYLPNCHMSTTTWATDIRFKYLHGSASLGKRRFAQRKVWFWASLQVTHSAGAGKVKLSRFVLCVGSFHGQNNDHWQRRDAASEPQCCIFKCIHLVIIHNMSASLQPETKEPEEGATESPLGSRLCGQLYCESKEHTSEIRLTADRHLSCSSY